MFLVFTILLREIGGSGLSSRYNHPMLHKRKFCNAIKGIAIENPLDSYFPTASFVCRGVNNGDGWGCDTPSR